MQASSCASGTFKRLVAITVCLTCVVVQQPFAAGAPPGTGVTRQVAAASALTFSGFVRRDGRTVANVRLRLRNVDTGAILGQTVSGQNGEFSFSIPGPGLYVVEAVDDHGKVKALSKPVPVNTLPVTEDVILSSSRVLLWTSVAVLVLAAGAGAGIVGWENGGGGNVVSPER